ncbi:hypothetical protein ABTX81_09855 [Kitasatospora sp. NPDC097605]|uniref:hypothetical protein n=1 Tax=Kitasatospora sp. NPDC097605 TaxID=3157226 RepID=UPI003333B71A
MKRSSQQQLDDVAKALLSDMPAWRLRAIERVELSSAFWSERDREIHVKPLIDVMTENDEIRAALSSVWGKRLRRIPDEIDLVLPITELPQLPVLDLRITVAEKRVYRVSRDEGARIQARHVIDLARHEAIGLMPAEEKVGEAGEPLHLVDFLTFLFYFPSSPYEQVMQRRAGNCRFPADRNFEYLTEQASGIPQRGLSGHYDKWKAYSLAIGNIAKGYVLNDYASGSENPLICLPYFFQELRERRPAVEPALQDVTKLLSYLQTAVATADAIASAKPRTGDIGRDEQQAVREAAARIFLTAYFGYGHRWMTFARCTIPLKSPFTIAVREKRAIYFTPKRRLNRETRSPRELLEQAWQMVAYADAETNHVSIRIEDMAVRLKGRPVVFDETARRPVEGEVDEEESTFELYFRQDSTRGRPGRIYIKCPLRLTRIQSGMLWLTILITGVAIGLLINRGVVDGFIADEAGETLGHNLTAKDAAVVLIPVAFAASFLLVRDSSTLSMWLRRTRQTFLMVELFALLALAFVLYWAHYIKAG